MPQASGAISMKNNKVEISTDGVNWIDISGYSNEVTWDGAERATEGTTTFSGDKMILTTGKRELVNVNVKAIYTEGLADPIPVAQAAYDNDTDLYIRWSPKNAVAGSKMHTTDAGRVKKPCYPQGSSSEATAVLADIDLVAPGVTVTTL